MPKIIIDGTEYEVKPGKNLLEAAIDVGLNLPYFCWHPAMGSVGACRLCAVRVYKDENDTKGKIQMACMTPAVDGTRMSIQDPEAAEFRRYVIEWLMTNHPHDCPVCDEGGECHLQDMTAMCGQVYRRFRFLKRTYRNQYLGPFVNHELNRCIQCYRCVRFYRDLAGGRDFNYFGSKNRVYFGRDKDGVLESEFSGNLVEVCPTGVFTDKTYGRHYTRKWDLQTAPSVCIHCGLGCNTNPGERYGTIRRVTARFNGDVNGYFLCDRGRYGYEFNGSQWRVESGEWRAAEGGARTLGPAQDALEVAANALSGAKGVVGIGSPRASLESNYALRKLVGEASFSTGLSEFEHAGAELALKILREGPARTPSLAEVELADVVLVLGADPTNEAPMLDFAIRQAMRKAPLDIARKLKIPDWDANAVATALQGAKGKLYIASPWRIKIEEIALESAHLAPDGIAAIAAEIDHGIRQAAGPSGLGFAALAARDLMEAHQPLVVTSISAGPEVMKAAANIAWALCGRGKDCWLSISVPEANTMGAAMLGGTPVDEALKRIEHGQADTLIVLENDLARRVSPCCLEAALRKARAVIALDCIKTGTTESADVLLPVSSFFESDGTFVNSEGRAQRFFQVFIPSGELRQPWRVLEELMGERRWPGFEDVLRELASERPEFAPAMEAAAHPNWRSPADQKVPRMPHRYSGRTAMTANVEVMERERPHDPQTPLEFTMEGTHNPPDPSLIPRFWWPGWNSENAINKFQIEVGGPLHGGNPGKRLIEPSGNGTEPFRIQETAARSGQMWIIPRQRIFGSEELSRLAEGIRELTPPAEAGVNPSTAAALHIADGQVVELQIGGEVHSLKAKHDDSVAPGVVTVPAGYPETPGVSGPALSQVAKP